MLDDSLEILVTRSERQKFMAAANKALEAERAQMMYKSQPLHLGTKQIRLLSLSSPSGFENPLSGKLRVVTLQHALKYSALSYVWGDVKERSSIYLEGVDIPITRNLASALRYLRTENKSRDIWIDALCINQKDNAEKSSQVRLMGEIYGNAETTFIWLGESGDNSGLAMDLVANICDDDFAKYEPEDPKWLALSPLFQREWWTRMWIVQEAMLSPRPMVRCGSKEVHHERFVDLKYLHEKWRETDLDHFDSLRPFDGVPYRDLFWRDSKEWLNGTLSSWIVSTTEFKATVLRDRVYALLGLIREDSRAAIDVNYDQSVKPDRKVVIEASVVLFKETGLLNLQWAQEDKDFDFELPSWCPDWTRKTAIVSLASFSFCTYTSRSRDGRPNPKAWQPGFEAGDADEQDFVRFSKDQEKLAVRGFIIGRVDFFDKTPHVATYRGRDAGKLFQSKKERAERTLDACLKWEQYVMENNLSFYSDTRQREEAFWRTIVADRSFFGDLTVPASTNLKSNFDAWMGRPLPEFSSWSEKEKLTYVQQYSFAAITRCAQRAFITTTNGCFGLAPEKVRKGDWVCVLHGGHVPFILRPGRPEDNACTFVGEAYIHGIMYGEYLPTAKPEDSRDFWMK